MIRVAFRSIVSRWARLALTSLAIIASTAFLAGTFVFRDTIERTFDALFANVYDRVDAYVQSSNSVENLFGFERRDRLPADVVEQDRVDSANLYKVLTEEVVPTFFNRDAQGIPRQWIARIRRALTTMAPQYST